MNYKHLIYFCILLCFHISCTSDDQIAPVTKSGGDVTIEQDGVLILNEGNFQWGNGTLSYYDFESNEVANSVFTSKNNRPLGDVPQSISTIGELSYIVVNNSNKIEVIDKSLLTSVKTIQGFNSPRYLLQVSNKKAYVTELYDDKVYIVDLVSHSITGNIPVEGWTDALILSNEKVFVQNIGQKSIVVIDPLTDTVEEEIKLEEAPIGVIENKNEEVFAIIKEKLIRLTVDNGQIQKTEYDLTGIESASKLRIDKDANKLYFINSDVYSIDLNASTLKAEKFIEADGKNYYGLGVNPVNGDVYVTDAKDYVQLGEVERYSSSGQLIDKFTVGVNPQDISFR